MLVAIISTGTYAMGASPALAQTCTLAALFGSE
jgi:hypothetical protein